MDDFTLPGYDILERVGVGGMATVWMARQLSLDRIVAIKVLTTNFVQPEIMDRFRLEARAAAKLNHPAIVQVYDAGEQEGLPFYVMEYVAGFTVGELLRRKGVLGQKHAILIAEGVAHALNYAWATAHMIHCDVKPDNIMIDRDGTVKVADLGLARIIGKAGSNIEDDLIIGTPNYISPEQSSGENNLDCRTDIYSLGAMLYHMMTGTLPFGHCEGSEAMDKQISSYLPDPMEINHSLPMNMAWLIEKMMVKNPEKRHQNWYDFLQDLEEVKAGNYPDTLPEAGLSTVIRSDRREHAPKPQKKPRGLQRVAPHKGSDDGLPKKKIVLTPEMRKTLQSASKSSSPKLQEAVFSMVLLLILVLGVYSVFFFLGDMPVSSEASITEQTMSDIMPPRSTAYTASKSASIAGIRAREKKKAEPVVEENPTLSIIPEDGPVSWNDPDFIQGARFFNRALKHYEKYLGNTAEAAILGKIERQCRQAIDAFESCRPRAPEDIDLERYINDAFRMIADARQFTLLEFSQDVREGASTEPDVTKDPNVYQLTDDGMTLAPTWNTPISGGSSTLKDLQEILAQHGRADMDLTPAPALRLFQGITYLMPLQEAAKAMGLRLTTYKRVECPGFPKNSFNYHGAKGQFGSGFNRILIITDVANRVVGVQLVNDNPEKNAWLEPELFKSSWHVYNFVESRSKARKRWKIAHRVEQLDGIYRIDSEIVEDDPIAYLGIGPPRERVMLYLPQQMVNLLLLRIEALLNPDRNVATR